MQLFATFVNNKCNFFQVFVQQKLAQLITFPLEVTKFNGCAIGMRYAYIRGTFEFKLFPASLPFK